jgi:GMP synthase (glutamine-hydrolysing)
MKAVSEIVDVRDCGSQYAHLIGRRVREKGVYSELTDSEKKYKRYRRVRGIIVSGGPSSVYKNGAPEVDPKTFQQDHTPVLGICYGMQLGARELGGKVKKGKIGEYGRTEIEILKDDPFFDGLDREQTVWMSHGDQVVNLPPGAELLAVTKDGVPAAFKVGNKYFVQFHPEVTHTPNGKQMIDNFLYRVCGAEGGWTTENQQDQLEGYIENLVGNKPVLLAASFGGDSNVLGKLLYNVIGKKLSAAHLDHGLELEDARKMKQVFRKYVGVNPDILDVSDRFLKALHGVDDPERKRKIIGGEFIKCFKELAKKYRKAFEFLGQGTLYPDVIESTSPRRKGKSAKIKSHHNVGGLPKILGFKLVEPLKWLFKDEVRRLGLYMGLVRDFVVREPFPGPGLAIRHVTNAFKPPKGMIENVQNIAGEFGLKGYVSPIHTVGVQGDARTYKNLVMLQGDPEWENLRGASEELIKQAGANRVVYIVGDDNHSQDSLLDLADMPLCRESLDILRMGDRMIRNVLSEYGLNSTEDYDQMPVVKFRGHKKPWLAMRPIRTEDYMTTSPLTIGGDIPVKCLERLYSEIMSTGEFEGFCKDISTKPPSTVCFE